MRERGGLGAAVDACAGGLAALDDVDAAAGVPRAVKVVQAAAEARAARRPRVVGARAVAAEEAGVSANAEEEYLEPDSAPTASQQSVNREKKL